MFLTLLFMSTSSLLRFSSTDCYYVNITREYYHFLLLEAVEILGHNDKRGLGESNTNGISKAKETERNSE